MITIIQSVSVGIREKVTIEPDSVLIRSISAGIADKRRVKGTPEIIRSLSLGVSTEIEIQEGKIIRVK